MSEPSSDNETFLATPNVVPRVAGFEVLQELGRGGMGVVYRARESATRREVALKLIRDAVLAGPAILGRFRIEAEAAARMRHPNIVEILSVGEFEGRPYFAMELVDGGGLDRLLDHRPLPPRSAAEIIHTLAEAVQHAHDQNVIHRDLKPANILVSRDVPTETPIDPQRLKITDFGLAKRLDSDSTAWTQDGTILGTVAYMAPEQAAGRSREIGRAVDIYALGAIFYELLTGRPPFHSDSVTDTIRQVLHEEPALPSRYISGIPKELEGICLKCLEKDAGQRYETAAELANDLNRYLQDLPVVAFVDPMRRLERQAFRDGYRLLGEVGRGPRSMVYRAIFEPLRQAVALKVYREGLVDRSGWEAQIARSGDRLSSVAHPQVSTILRAGWWNGSAYLAVDYAAHGTLAKRAKESIADTIRIVRSIAEVVVYLHRQGVVHGNLKPGNVLMGADGFPRLTDFRDTGGLFVGSSIQPYQDSMAIRHLAPETLDFPDATPLPTADVYGLGLILYERLTGRPAFSETSPDELVRQIREELPLPPSHFNANVTPGLDASCLRCLNKKPSERYLRVYGLLKRLQYLEDEFPTRHTHFGRGH